MVVGLPASEVCTVPTYLLGTSTITYGQVHFGSGCLIENSVIIGHPSPGEISRNFRWAKDSTSIDEFYKKISNGSTIIGSNAIIRSGTVIYSGSVVGNNFDCGHNVIIREGVKIGNDVYLKNNSEIMRGATIGDGCRIAGVVADGCIIGNRVSSFGVLTHKYAEYVQPRTTIESNFDAPAAPVINDDAIVGRGAVVIGGQTVGRGAIIGANAVVTFSVPPNSLALGPKATLRS